VPDFLVPRPSAPPPAGGPADTNAEAWRERIANIEVQLSATRSSVQRMQSEFASLREKLDETASKLVCLGELTSLREKLDQTGHRFETSEAEVRASLERIEAEVRASLERIEAIAEQALQRADKPLPIASLEARMSEIEALATVVRAGLATLQQELAESRRLDEARHARIESLEGRLLRAESDPRPVELRLAIDRLEARVIAAEREQRALREQLEARVIAAEREQRALREQLEARVVAAEREQRALREQLEALFRLAGEERARIDRLTEAWEEIAGHLRRSASDAPPARTLRDIPGIGPKSESKLRAAGIASADDLAALDAEGRSRIARMLGIKQEKFDAWCEAARAR
jgi:predicted flap endonuclease-1-like 5' DNA nuclease